MSDIAAASPSPHRPVLWSDFILEFIEILETYYTVKHTHIHTTLVAVAAVPA